MSKDELRENLRNLSGVVSFSENGPVGIQVIEKIVTAIETLKPDTNTIKAIGEHAELIRRNSSDASIASLAACIIKLCDCMKGTTVQMLPSTPELEGSHNQAAAMQRVKDAAAQIYSEENQND